MAQAGTVVSIGLTHCITRSVRAVGRAVTVAPAYDQLLPSQTTSNTVPGIASASTPVPLALSEATPFAAPFRDELSFVGTVGESAVPPRSPVSFTSPRVVDVAAPTGGLNDIFVLRSVYFLMVNYTIVSCSIYPM